ncbi:hypothetical protein BJ944DRAFT_197152 [Cunninghamella echinulata]|nr:hypothetical protein BJ944DRAFT_197152 [Cunninghamella echinulata]
MSEQITTDKLPTFKKRSTKNQLRKRQRSPESKSNHHEDDDHGVSEVVTKERKTMKTPFIQSTRRLHKSKNKEGQAEGEGDEDNDLGFGEQYQADRSAVLKKDDATRYTTEYELDAEAIEAMESAISSGKAKKGNNNAAMTKNKVNGKLQVGPQKAPANLRVTARFDYQPDICKDYKETGFCGYGDSCIFLHDRGDYKTGWELDKEWEEAQKNKNKSNQAIDQYAVSDSDDDSDDEEVPFACLICRNEFKEPVVTKCKHYFCESCAIRHFKSSSKCFACGAPTNGVFNTAKNILEKLRAKKERLKENQNDGQEDDEKKAHLEGIEGLETKDSDDDDDDDSGSDSD